MEKWKPGRRADVTWEEGVVKVEMRPLLDSPIANMELAQVKDAPRFRELYPLLYAVMAATDEDPENSGGTIGEIGIFTEEPAEDSPPTVSVDAGKEILRESREVKADIERALRRLASDAQAGHPSLENVDYFVGVSRLATIAARYGFDVFELQSEDDVPHFSHKFAVDTYVRHGMDPDKASAIAQKRPAALAIITRQKLIDLYGNTPEAE